MNFKNCKHYNEVVRVLSENLNLEDINFEIDETEGCECKDGESVCELWVTLALAHDMAPQLGIEHAEQTISNLDSRMKEIATLLVSSVGNKTEPIDEPEILPEPIMDNQWYESLTQEQKNLIAELNELDNTTNKIDELKYTNEIILEKLIESCLNFNPELFHPYLQSEKVTTDMPDKTRFYSFFQQMLLCAKDNSVEPMTFKIEKANWENDISMQHYNLYDSVHKHSRLCIKVKESDGKIYLDIMPF